jgi:two-component system, response regulator YesN
MDLLVFSNLIAPTITGLFFLLYFIYFIFAIPSRAISYKFFIIFLICFSIFLFGRPLQLVLGPHPLPLIIVNIRVFILCSIISPVIILASNIFKKKNTNIKQMEILIICICILLGITYCIFNTLGTKASYTLFEFAQITAYDNLTPSLLPPYYGREVTIGVQIVTGIVLFLFSFFTLIKLKLETPLKDFIKNKIFLINSGILIFTLSFIIGSIAKQWWIYYASSIMSALLFGGSVLLDIKEVYHYYEKLIPFIKEDIIHNVPFSEFSKRKLTEMLKCLGKKSNLDTFIIVKIKETSLEFTDNLKKIDEMTEVIKKFLNYIFSDEEYLLLPLSNNKIGIIIRLINHAGEKIYILDLLEDIKEEIHKKIRSVITIGIGRSYARIEDLRVSYYEALNAQGYAEQFSKSSIIHVENINDSASVNIAVGVQRMLSTDQYINKYPVREKEELLSLMKVGDVQNSKEALDRFLCKFSLFIEENPEILKVRLYELVGSLIDSAILSGGDEEKLNELVNKYFHDINYIKDIQVVEKWLSKVVLEIVGIVAAVYERRSKVLVEHAKKYIEENYRKQLSYKEVAKEIYISPSYFLNLFKQETGKTFVDYLTHLRINKAKKLLLSTELNITEIAFETGFNNSNYFSSIFKKITGSTAKEYRKNIEKNR